MSRAAGLVEAAERHLLGALAAKRLFPGFTDPEEDEGEDLAIDAFAAIGALTAEEAGTWRARFARARDRVAEPDPALQRRAIAHLRRLETAGEDVIAAANAFVGARAITESDAARWLGRSQVAIGRPTAEEAGEWGVPDRFDDSAFRRSLLGPETREAGMRVTVVELYEGATVVYWHFDGSGDDPRTDGVWSRIADDDFHERLDPDDEATFDPLQPVALADDLGTAYHDGPSAYTRGEHARYASGYCGFAPGVPADASCLDVAIGDVGPVRLGLDGGA